VVAFDPASGELRPFQEVMFRRRKYGIADAARDRPVSLFCFELLYADGQDLTRLPYPERRARLAEAITPSARLRLSTAIQVSDTTALEAAFEQAVTDGCEGLLCKSVSPTAGYQAGARGWLWIKLKRDYRTELSDTVDLVVVGALAGRGRRRGIYGALLLAAYDPAADVFRTVCKCGTGFSDAELAALPERLASLARAERPARVDARQGADVWFEPALVVEVLGAELTCRPTTPPGGALSRKRAGWRCASHGSPDAGATTRLPRTPPPPRSWWTCTTRRGGHPRAPERPVGVDGPDGAAIACAVGTPTDRRPPPSIQPSAYSPAASSPTPSASVSTRPPQPSSWPCSCRSSAPGPAGSLRRHGHHRAHPPAPVRRAAGPVRAARRRRDRNPRGPRPPRPRSGCRRGGRTRRTGLRRGLLRV
jgi:hypothetical protein